MTDEKKTLGMKLNAFRKDAIVLDWKDDGRVEFKAGGSYKYLSADKVKKQLSPLLAKHGLELKFEYSDLTRVSAPESSVYHFTLKLTAMILDMDTNESLSSQIYGEGADTGDKAIPKAQTAALRMWLTTFLLIADGIDPDAEPRSKFNSSSAEKEEMRSAALEKAIPPKMKPAESPQSPQNLAEKPDEISDEETPTPTVGAPQNEVKTAKLASPLVKTIENISASMLKKSQNGTIPLWEYEAYVNERDAAKTTADYSALIKRYK